MNELIDVIQNLGISEEKSISDYELDLIRSHREEASSYFHEVLDLMRHQDIDETLEDEQLLKDGMFALFFFAEWRDAAAFAKVGEILSLLGEEEDAWLGDIVTENLPHLLYQMFDGDYRLLKRFIYDTQMGEFSRIDFVMIAVQSYLDNRISLDFLLQMMRDFENVPEDDLSANVITFICDYMMRAHIEEYLPDVRRWIQRGWVDPQVIGDVADHVDTLYDYRRDEVIRTEYSLKKEAGYWYKFQNSERVTAEEASRNLDSAALLELLRESEDDPYKGTGRNAPCPCGSGKKFKKCCLPLLERSGAGADEAPLVRFRKTEFYPELSYDPVTGLMRDGFERRPGRRYLEDLYDREAILIDYYMYLARETLRKKSFSEMALNPSARNRDRAERRKIAEHYIRKAEELRRQKMVKENICDFATFDKKYAIHFLCDEWEDLEERD